MVTPEESPEALFVRVLGVPVQVAQALLSCGHTSVEEVAYVPLNELLETPGVPEWLLQELRERARTHLMKY